MSLTTDAISKPLTAGSNWAIIWKPTQSLALVIDNVLLVAASLLVGPRLLQLWHAGVLVNVVALMLMVVPLLN